MPEVATISSTVSVELILVTTVALDSDPQVRLTCDCEFDVQDDAFKVIELREGRLSRGVLRYSQPFHQV
jgi:hypothetical protein